MSTSFDDRAKAAAERNPTASGLSRRQLVQRGALVVGTAWTAPMLLTATPAWAGASICTGTDVYSTCGNGTKVCCPSGTACVLKFGTVSTYVCDTPIGGVCNNNGNGQCDGGYSRCNHLGISTCGGPGAYCDFSNNSVCVSTSPCYPQPINGVPVSGARCGGTGAPCTTNSECATGSTGNAPDLTCIKLAGATTGTCG